MILYYVNLYVCTIFNRLRYVVSMIITQKILQKSKTCVDSLIERNFRIVFAESCTCGLMSFLFSCIPGASRVLDHSFVVYSNESKVKLLGIDKDVINKYGAVSPEVCNLMAIGALKSSKANVSISVTGFAGPSVGTEQVGLVYIGCAFSDVESEYKKCCFGNMNRYEIQISSVDVAMDFLLYRIFNKSI